MPSTVYRGDLTEITFGHESGITIEHNAFGSVNFIAKSGARDKIKDTSVIKFTGGASGAPIVSAKIAFPRGMLVGSQLVFSGLDGSPWDVNDNYSESGRVYTIVAQSDIELTISPHLLTDHSDGDITSDSGALHILPFKTPSMDTSMTHAGHANDAAERVLTDQFVGLVGTVALPETVVDLKRYHVVGLGRDVAVQTPGRFINTGGSFECNIHNGRWFYYALGHEVAKLPLTAIAGKVEGTIAAGTATAIPLDGAIATVAAGDALFKSDGTYVGRLTAVSNSGADSTMRFEEGGTKVQLTTADTLAFSPSALCGPTSTSTSLETDGNISPGDSYFAYSGTAVSELGASDNEPPAAGDYVIIPEFNTTDVHTHRETASDGTWPAQGADSVISKAIKTEIRRIVAINNSKIWVDDPFNFHHDTDMDIYFCRFMADGSNGSPNLLTTTASSTAGTFGTLQNPVEKLIYSRTNLPSFAMEVSIRRNDTGLGAGTAATEVVDGSAGDSKQLTRVFRGCKVKDFSLKADTDAALKMTVNFDAALCYTDTGRLEDSEEGDRYDAHRLFEDTANTEVKRKESGIAKRTQKPFMFYNGTMRVKGTTLGQVVSFQLNGSTGVQQFYTITGANVADSKTDQVPFAGTRNPTISVAGKTEYDMEMEIIVDDPLFYHNMRRSIDNFDDTTTDTTDADMIRLSFVKQGGSGTKETIEILIDDYFITEAPLPIPEDKGPIRSMLKIMPKSIKVITIDPVFHS
tara:strand:+ start:1059 stop:3299 length:2241 start_codon:yes stop_codon:yes gene_type:complete